ncbi:MAG: hypothetical protein NZ518_07600, partial [Dehalococcoidia bacterium]|nr:hypothetical protein [Dehalococcoidia bacterium]
MRHPQRWTRAQGVGLLRAVVGWAWLATAVGHVFAPWHASVRTFAADNAIVVLMANDPTIDLFHLYYFGQDRFGAWPFLLMQFAAIGLGVGWTVDAIYLVQTLWLCAGALALGAVAKRFALYLAVAYLCAVALNVAVAPYIFQIGQPYAWQIPALLFSWWSLRALGDATVFPDAQGVGRRWALTTATAGIAFLAIWSSAMSAPLLIVVALAEALRASVARAALVGDYRRWAGRLGALAAPVAL